MIVVSNQKLKKARTNILDFDVYVMIVEFVCYVSGSYSISTTHKTGLRYSYLPLFWGQLSILL